MQPHSFTRLPHEIVEIARQRMPHVEIGEIIARALRRVIRSSPSERQKMVAAGGRFLPERGTPEDILKWDSCPHSVDVSVWVEFAATLEKRREHPAKVLAGAVMVEIGME